MRQLGCLGLMFLCFPVAIMVWWILMAAAASVNSTPLLLFLMLGLPGAVFVWANVVSIRNEGRERDEGPDSTLY